MIVYNETQNKTYYNSYFYNYSSYYSVSIDANVGDIISVYLYDYYGNSTNTRIYFPSYQANKSTGTISAASESVEYGSSYTWGYKEVEGYTFKGFYTEENGQGTQLTDETGASITNWTYTENMTVYAYYVESAE